MRGEKRRLAGDLRAALVGHQRDMMAAPFQLGRERKGGKQMAAGAACGEDEMARNAGDVICHVRTGSLRSIVSRER